MRPFIVEMIGLVRWAGNISDRGIEPLKILNHLIMRVYMAHLFLMADHVSQPVPIRI